jgi:hypothetical protein
MGLFLQGDHFGSDVRYSAARCAIRGTLEGLRKPTERSVIVVTLLAYRPWCMHVRWMSGTVARWRDRVGKHCTHVHEAIVHQGHLDLIHVQADEMRVKGRRMGS